MRSAIYRGQLRHRRFSPRAHEFSYSLFMMYVDLAELDSIFKGRWLWSTSRPAFAWLRRADYLGDACVSLDEAVRDRVQFETGTRPKGSIRMLTHLRYFGIGFNPVTFYYCFDRDDTRVEFIVAEITNTPWKERHAYVLSASASTSAPSPVVGESWGEGALQDEQPKDHPLSLTLSHDGRGDKKRMLRFLFHKSFHVSPFMPMDIDYDWRFSEPTDHLSVHMQNMQSGKVFDATLNLRRYEITGTSLSYTLIAFPLMTVKVIAGIYWQALRLWLKRTPFHSHPRQSTVNSHEHDTATSSSTS